MTDKKRGRPAGKQSRANATRRERRFNAGATSHTGMKLTVDESKLDRDLYTYRFANDKDNRISQLEAMDWDVVSDDGDTDGAGTVQSKIAGSVDGKPYQTVLMRKYKDWHEEDQRRKQAEINNVEQAIEDGGSSEDELREGVYTPDGGNRIGAV